MQRHMSERLNASAQRRRGGKKKLLKFIGRKKGINCRIHYTASTVPRTGKVRLLVWHAV